MPLRWLVAAFVLLATLASRAIAADFKIAVNLPYEDPNFGSAVMGLKNMLKLFEPDLAAIDPVTNHSVSLIYNPTSLSAAQCTSAALSTTINDGVVGIVGDYYSSMTIPQAYTSKYFKTWMCSGSATSVALSSDVNFPYFFRTIGNDYQQGASIATFVKHMGWTRINIIAATDFYGQSLSTGLARQADILGINVTSSVTYTPYSTNFDMQLAAMKDTGTMINFIAGTSLDGLYVLRAAKAAGMIGPDWVWMSADSFSAYYSMGSLKPSDITNANGLLYVSPKEVNVNPIATAFKARWDSAYPGLPVPPYGYLFRDCVFAMAQGVIKARLRTIRTIRSRTAHLARSKGASVVQSRNYDLLLNDLVREFEGASGRFQVDKYGDRVADFVISNLYEGKVVDSYVVWANLTVERAADIKFYNGKSTVPSDRYTQAVLIAQWTTASGIALGATAIALLAIIIATTAYIFVIHRNKPFVASLSKQFLLLITFGCVLVLLSSIASMGIPTAGSCMASLWLFGIGVNLVIAIGVAKTYRTWTTFESRSTIKISGLNDRILYAMVTLIMLGQILILVIWSAAEPPIPITVAAKTYIYTQCNSPTPSFQNAIVSVSIAYNAIFLVIFLYFSFATRNVPSVFNEHKSILYSGQNIMLSSIVVTPFATFDFTSSTLSAFIVKHSIIFSAVTFVFVALVGRLALEVNGNKDASKLLSSSSLASQSGKSGSSAAKPMSPSGHSVVWSAKGTYPVMQVAGLLSQWRTMRVQLYPMEGILVMMPDDGTLALGVVLDVAIGRFHTAPNGYEHVIEVIAEGKSWMVQFSDVEEHKRWAGVLGAISNASASSPTRANASGYTSKAALLKNDSTALKRVPSTN
ncbi:hypothetical protein H9P43_001068 [Blastocladiella emersonii ATCC 22665]|nr:hypothetical protein H9P43_001068 [Blastocladiella emersonii ATCC 22665]